MTPKDWKKAPWRESEAPPLFLSLGLDFLCLDWLMVKKESPAARGAYTCLHLLVYSPGTDWIGPLGKVLPVTG